MESICNIKVCYGHGGGGGGGILVIARENFLFEKTTPANFPILL